MSALAADICTHWTKLERSTPLTLMVPPPSRVSNHMFGLRVAAYLRKLALALAPAMSEMADN
jgi:hypothetical protein